MARTVYLPDAIEDLHQIWAYIVGQTESVEIADRLIDSIDNVASLYAANPALGTARNDLAPGLRCFVVARYVVFFLPLTGGIEIVQVIHGSRDIPARFRRPRS
ncbi:MAG: type II toxin-antitoxin system RelE/ParE family toxin [Pirellulales bacterium]|nr:type II toxin-antitoxin system RelE/ParE family toxin [Pirellulales bacterium]